MIMMLEVCQKDFEALIKRFEMQREYAKKEGEGRLDNVCYTYMYMCNVHVHV